METDRDDYAESFLSKKNLYKRIRIGFFLLILLIITILIILLATTKSKSTSTTTTKQAVPIKHQKSSKSTSTITTSSSTSATTSPSTSTSTTTTTSSTSTTTSSTSTTTSPSTSTSTTTTTSSTSTTTSSTSTTTSPSTSTSTTTTTSSTSTTTSPSTSTSTTTTTSATSTSPVKKLVNCADNSSSSPAACNKTKNDFSLTLMTFNIQFYETSKGPKSIAQFILHHKPDVVCLQENINFYWNGKENTQLDLSSDYILAGECQAEKWSTGYLLNTVYILRIHEKNFQTLPSINLTIASETARCAALIQLYDTRIANLHLCGGRFDDKNYGHFQQQKHLQLQRLIDRAHPDIIIGDFNSEDSFQAAEQQLLQYPFYTSLNSEQQNLFMNYYISGASYLRDSTDYKPAYNESTVGMTSVYGGTPDWFYVRDLKRVTGRVQTFDTVLKKLSDHNAVMINYFFSQ